MFEELTKEAVDELVLKLQPVFDKFQAMIKEEINFALENALDRISGAKVVLPDAKAVPL